VTDRLTPNLLLQAYARGLFPMAESNDNPELFWVDPDVRGVIPLTGFHLPRRLRRTVRQDRYRVTINRAFDQVIRACAETDFKRGRFDSWINAEVVRAYSEMHRLGFAHSVECWQDDQLAGGLYGLALRGAFFGESMFSRATDASKVALVHLVARLRESGFLLLDSQFVNDHLKQFGVLSVPRDDFQPMLAEALAADGDFTGLPPSMNGATALSFLDQG